MHLKQLKLAGFKSFVDPTILPFSSQLIAVVGPNGCGKSNIIDAIRWVMGESSAKHLRGESMADVIFNGSSTRKAVGQASVELLFDNSLGRLGGPYASYQEIVVKRLVTRDGDSFYYLNGSRCRRRDITDIFLGTGAGARSYSIIGQNTISRLIEARPEELRAYLEEAAGVSKYKERRRETMQRITSTRENLARVADICEELAKQLQRLEKQANAALRYQALKKEERLYRVRILALKWQVLNHEQVDVTRLLNELSCQHEQYQAQLTACLKNEVQFKEAYQQAQDEFQQSQLEFYQLGTAIARLEEQLQQHEREKQSLGEDKRQIEADLQVILEQLQQDTTRLGECTEALRALELHLQSVQHELQQHQAQLDEKKLQKNAWEERSQQAQTRLHQAQRDMQSAGLTLQHLEQQHQQLHLNLEKIQQESHAIDIHFLQQQIATSHIRRAELQDALHTATETHQQSLSQGQVLRQQLTQVEQQLHQAQDNLRLIATEHAVLQARQQVALRQGKQETSATAWDKHPRLAELISVSQQWMPAVELVLGPSLQAIVIDDITTLHSALSALQGQEQWFVEHMPLADNKPLYPRLSDKIEGALPRWHHALEQVFAADNLAEALTWLPHLNATQSVVTMDGYWLGHGWVRVQGTTAVHEVGLLARQQQLVQLNESLLAVQTQLTQLQSVRDALQQRWTENGQKQQGLEQALRLSQDALRDEDAALHRQEHALIQAEKRLEVLVEEVVAHQQRIEDSMAEKIQTETHYQRLSAIVAQYEHDWHRLISEKNTWDETLVLATMTVDTLRQTVHQVDLQHQSMALKIQQYQDSLQREQQRQQALQTRWMHVQQRLETLSSPDTIDSVLLTEKIQLHHTLEEALNQQRQQVDEKQHLLHENERLNKQTTKEAQHMLEQIQQVLLQEQHLLVRANGLIEALTALDADVSTVLTDIPVDLSLQAAEQFLEDVEEKIKRLGAINLIAIEEYQTELTRKQHLDAQYQDLLEALATLDTAIAKMDKETELRLKETFEQVNQTFQSLFPRLFGGGCARLELTCDNLLEAGIVVMAQPPGKRNSTIHLLSGGEKAMTAVALVFAIFQLNPSPFCMLDEVDAPLDDLNVQRFCALVKEMSSLVQFLFITHNKVTMELADHLIGVTMREPGVSRVVAVDVEEALLYCAEAS